ncbi:MAG: transcription antitermination factor NusB [Microthrixaceae bacterium]
MSDPGGVAARRTALEVLARVEDDGAYSNLVLGSVLDRSGLGVQDRGFVTDLVYGTLRRRRALDHLANRFLTSDPPPAARRVLRLGAYQLVERDDIPAYAAVGATVEAAPKRFRGLANAVLRKVSTAPVTYPDEATRLSYPDWMVDRLVADLGHDDAVAALESMNEPAAATVRGDGYTQDLASQWVVDLVGAAAGERVLDLCAAPGGKATGMAMSGATVLAADLQPQRVGLIVDNARRWGHPGVHAVVADATHPPFRAAGADRVLLDAPCSGLGVLRRRPDARWRLDPDAPDRLARLQRRLVEQAIDLVAPGGLLVLSVCTLTAVESLGLDEHVATSRPDLQPLDPPGGPWRPWGRGAILLPQAAGTDGMCCFRYRVPA